jgi:hypothetical protein
MTEEHKRKISEAQKGRVFTPEHRRKLSESHKGKPTWDKGIKRGPLTPEWRLKISLAGSGKIRSEETRRRISAAQKGRTLTKEQRKKLSDAHIGKQAGPMNPNWRGGTKSERQRAMGTGLYRQWRNAVFERDDYRCYSCGKRGARLEAHHLYPWSEFPRIRLVLENGITLCDSCHDLISPRLKGPDSIVAPAGMILCQ